MKVNNSFCLFSLNQDYLYKHIQGYTQSIAVELYNIERKFNLCQHQSQAHDYLRPKAIGFVKKEKSCTSLFSRT